MKPWAWRLWLLAMIAAMLLLFAAQLVRAMPLQPGDGVQRCETGLVTRHDAFYSMVLQVFPERAQPGAHGYVGVADCSMMGELATLWLGGYSFDVVVADCLNRTQKASHDALWGDTWLADVDRKIWIESGVANRPVLGALCYASSPRLYELANRHAY